MCESLLRSLTWLRESHLSDGADPVDVLRPPTVSLDLPPGTLARDMGALVGDQQYADVRFFAEGKAIMAHRFILESRSEYFRAMFRTGITAASLETLPQGVVDVVVPDTFVGFLRLLIFLYTDTLPDGSDGALLEDLMSADRFVYGGDCEISSLVHCFPLFFPTDMTLST